MRDRQPYKKVPTLSNQDAQGITVKMSIPQEDAIVGKAQTLTSASAQ